MRGTRVRWDGAAKVLALGFAAVAALIALPSLLGGEAPPPPADVGLATIANPAPPPPVVPTAPPQKPKRLNTKGGKQKGDGRRGGPNRGRRGRKRARRVRRDRAGSRRRAGSQRPSAIDTAPPSGAFYGLAPAPARSEQFGFER